MFANLRQLSGSPGITYHKPRPHSCPIFHGKREVVETVDTAEEYQCHYGLSPAIGMQQVCFDCTFFSAILGFRLQLDLRRCGCRAMSRGPCGFDHLPHTPAVIGAVKLEKGGYPTPPGQSQGSDRPRVTSAEDTVGRTMVGSFTVFSIAFLPVAG